MPDDHSKLVPPLPIPNRTVKQLCADDSAATSVKVGYRQASYIKKAPSSDLVGAFFRPSPLVFNPHLADVVSLRELRWCPLSS